MLSYHDTASVALLQRAQFGRQIEVPLSESPEGAQAVVELLASDVARWCRKVAAEPLPPAAVPGANDKERSQLAALGGLARAMAQRTGQENVSRTLPADVRSWLAEGPEPPLELTNRLLACIDATVDPLALIYEKIVAGHRRRQLGTFFTASSVMAYIKNVLASALQTAPSTVVDPGAGVGAFTTAALDWWPNARVHAVDVNLVTLGLLAVRPKNSITNTGKQPRLKIRQQDFLSWLGRRWPAEHRPRLILGNPPYTRHQQLSAALKKQAQEACADVAPGLRAGLSTYFLAAGLRSLGPQDSLCLLIPHNWLEADYGKSIRRYLWAAVNRRVELHIFSNQEGIFSGAQVGAMVVFVGPSVKKIEPMVIHHVGGNLTEGFTSVNSFPLARGSAPLSAFNMHTWSHKNGSRPRQKDTEVPLGEVVHIRRGVATGANHFFLRSLTDRQKLDSELTVRAISRLRDLNGNILDRKAHDDLSDSGISCWMLALEENSADTPAVASLLEEGIKEGIHERYLCKARSPWYVLEKIVPPDLLIGPMGKEGFRIVINSAGAIPTNTLYGMRMRRHDGTGADVNRLAEWLAGSSGQDALRMRARRHGDGLLKLEPGSLATVHVPRHVINS